MAFVSTTDVARARAFYEGVLGLAVLDQNPGACTVDANGRTLRITAVSALSPQPFTVLGWEVHDIDGTVRGLDAAGVRFERFDGLSQDERGIWTAPSGDRVAWFKDPDGNILSVSQHPG